MQLERPINRGGFNLAIICELEIHEDAIPGTKLSWDQTEPYGKARGDPNVYFTGHISGHNVVIARDPNLETFNAARVAINCRNSFLNVDQCIVLGNCTIPENTGRAKKISPGDVIVSHTIITSTEESLKVSPDEWLVEDTLSGLNTGIGLMRGGFEVESQLLVHRGPILSTNTDENVGNIPLPSDIVGIEQLDTGICRVAPCILIKGACHDSHSRDVKAQLAAQNAAAFTKLALRNCAPIAIDNHSILKFYPISDALTYPFIGREKELKQLNSILAGSHDRCIVVKGPSGMGKTWLVRQYLETAATKYTTIIWLDARNSTALYTSIYRTLQKISRLYPPGPDFATTGVVKEDTSQIMERVVEWLDAIGNWLMIYDAYGDMEHDMEERSKKTVQSRQTDAFLAAHDISQACLKRSKGSIIITTRRSIFEEYKSITLERLAEKESLVLLGCASKDGYAKEDAINLVAELNGVPLALTLAQAYMCQVQADSKRYLQIYRDLRSEERDQLLPLSAIELIMYLAWSISYKDIQQRSQKAFELLRVWSSFDSEGACFELLRSIGHEQTSAIQEKLLFDESMDILRQYRLVDTLSTEEDSGVIRYNMKRQVHDLLGKSDPKMAWKAVEYILRFLTACDDNDSSVIENYILSHAERCFAHISKDLSQCDYSMLRKVTRMWRFFEEQGHCDKLNLVHTLAIQRFKDMTKQERLQSYADRAVKSTHIYQNEAGFLHDFKKALESPGVDENNPGLLEALLGFEESLQQDESNCLHMVKSLSKFYQSQQEPKKAKVILLRAFGNFRTSYKTNHPLMRDAVKSLSDFFEFYKPLFEPEKDEGIFLRAFQYSEATYGPENASTVSLARILSALYISKGKPQESEKMLDHALQGFTKNLELDDIYMSEVLNGIVRCYCSMDHQAESAEKILFRAFEGCKDVLSKPKLNLQESQYLGGLYRSFLHVANHYQEREQHTKARQLYIPVVELAGQRLGRYVNLPYLGLRDIARDPSSRPGGRETNVKKEP